MSAIAAIVVLAGLGAAGAVQPCPRCGLRTPEAGTTVVVATVDRLFAAVAEARPGTTILLRAGTYRLNRMLDIAVPDVTIRGQFASPGRVTLLGPGIAEQQVRVALSVSAPRVTIADLTIGRFGAHAVQVRGERKADGVVLHNIRAFDTGQQLIKGSRGEDGRGPHEGMLGCSILEYTNHAPSSYTNGIDVIGGHGWVVRGNTLRRIRGPQSEEGRAGPAILFWGDSRDTKVEHNLLLDCHRGIALGLERREPGPGSLADDAARADHRGGLIRRNAIASLDPRSDESIEVNACPGVRVEHNTVFVEGKVPWSISVRFLESSAEVRNNLTNRPVLTRDDARIEAAGNIENAQRDWFAALSEGNLRLARVDLPPVDAATPLDDEPPFSGAAPDVGAYEFEVKVGPKVPLPKPVRPPSGGRGPRP